MTNSMFFFERCDNRSFKVNKQKYDVLKRDILKVVDILAVKQDVYWDISDPLLKEAYAHASKSLCFYNLDEVNHFKEIAHIIYWICRIKPINLRAPFSVKQISDFIDAIAGGAHANFKEEDKKFLKNVDNKRRKVAQFPINEHVAVNWGIMAIETAWCHQLEPIADSGAHKLVAERIKFLKGRFVNKYSDDLILSLRSHNHSVRSLALFLETNFQVSTDIFNEFT